MLKALLRLSRHQAYARHWVGHWDEHWLPAWQRRAGRREVKISMSTFRRSWWRWAIPAVIAFCCSEGRLHATSEPCCSFKVLQQHSSTRCSDELSCLNASGHRTLFMPVRSLIFVDLVLFQTLRPSLHTRKLLFTNETSREAKQKLVSQPYPAKEDIVTRGYGVVTRLARFGPCIRVPFPWQPDQIQYGE